MFSIEARTPTGRPAKLPARVAAQPGLDAGTVMRLRRKAEKMARTSNANFPMIFLARILAALADRGLARLSVKECLSLAQMANDMPAELATAIACFIAAHPPAVADHRGMAAALRAGALGGVPGLIQLHLHIIDRQRKARAKVAKMTPPNPHRPRLLPLQERNKARAKLIEREAEIANAALARLYRRRHEERFRGWALDFIEVCMALRDAGFQPVENQRKIILELAEEHSV
jgi:hypothetical protein